MRLVEVVVLVGSQCVSPVQQTPHATVASKVPCAVVIHRDTEKNTVAVIPASEKNHPKVREALGLAGDTAPPPLLTGSLPERAKPETSLARPASVASSTDHPPAAKPAAPVSVPTPQGGEAVTPAELLPRIEPTSARPDLPATERRNAVDRIAEAKAEPEVPASPGMQPPGATATIEATPGGGTSAESQAGAGTPAASAGDGPTGTVAHENDECRGAARPHWYTNKAGKRRYRCLIPRENNADVN